MLRLLRIRNLAVLEAVEIEFEPGFNVLTGETGAGKSIVVEAVGLLLGARASADLVRTGESHAAIEAIFEHDEAEIIVRRELTSQGRSRSFINGALATSAALRDLSARLVELHGQHEHQALLDPLTHLPLVDEYAELTDLAVRVADAWTGVRTLREQLERSRMDAREKAARLDLIAFQLGEIEKAAPEAGEDDTLTAARRVLASAERVQALCEESYAALYESDGAVLASLGGIWKRLGELAALDPQFASYVEARDGIKSQLEDLAFFLRSYADAVDASPRKLQNVEDRLAALERLKRKYGPTLEDVRERGRSLARERDLLTGAGARAEDLQQALTDAGDRYLEAARELSRKRRQAAGQFARNVEALLAGLAMERTRFDVRFNGATIGPEEWSERGIDRAEFYVSPNPGEELRPLARIVSGGELSRVMLALKTLTIGDAPGKTLIFDEVDAGIGGRVAEVVGERLRGLGGRFQVLCITHLPQIAARGATHFRIEKSVRSGRTATSVERLTDAGRVEEIARMIGGAVVTDAVYATARDLLAGGSAEVGLRYAPAGQFRGTRPTYQAKGESESPQGRKRKPAGSLYGWAFRSARTCMARKYLIETFGCQMNVHDSERMAGLLGQAGYEPTDDDLDADVIVINTCSVRERAEEKLYTRLGELRVLGEQTGRHPVVAVAGCVAQQEGRSLLTRTNGHVIDVVVGTQRLKMLPMLIEKAAGSAVAEVDINPWDDVSFPLGIARRTDPVKAYVTIIEGCNDHCAFCVVPYTRGHERMRAKTDILADVRQAVESGRREIQLLGQIVNHYQAPDDSACDFAQLLAEVNDIPGVERIRFASPHPRHTGARLIEAVRDLPKVCKHMHLPVQSGSTRVLRAMRRRHTREEYLDLAGRIREAIPAATLSTDIIVGFPGETTEDFDQTLSLVAAVQYHSMFSFKYSARPNTLASTRLLDDVGGDEKTARIVALQSLQREIQARLHERLVGTTLEVLVDAASRRREAEMSGRTTGNTVVNFPIPAGLDRHGPERWIGRTVPVTIRRAGPNSLWGEMTGTDPASRVYNHAD